MRSGSSVSLLRKNGGSLLATNAVSCRELLNAANGNQSSGIRSARNSARTNEGLKPDVPCGAVGNRNPEGSLKLMAVLSLEQKSSGGLSTFLLESLQYQNASVPSHVREKSDRRIVVSLRARQRQALILRLFAG